MLIIKNFISIKKYRLKVILIIKCNINTSYTNKTDGHHINICFLRSRFNLNPQDGEKGIGHVFGEGAQ